MWEFEECKRGGRFVLRVPKTHTNVMWENLTLSLIGEQFRVEGDVIGLVIAVKPQNDTISIWNRDSKDEEKLKKLREDIERICMFETMKMRLEYECFEDLLNKMNE